MDTLQNSFEQNKGEMTIKDWIITYVILFFSSLIPLLPVVILLYWAFSENTVLCKKNWAKASLIFYLAVFVLALILYFTVIAAAMANMPEAQPPM